MTTNSARNLLELLSQPYVDNPSPRDHKVAAREDRMLEAIFTAQAEEWEAAGAPQGLHVAVLLFREVARALITRAEQYDAAGQNAAAARPSPTPRPATARAIELGRGSGDLTAGSGGTSDENPAGSHESNDLVTASP